RTCTYSTFGQSAGPSFEDGRGFGGYSPTRRIGARCRQRCCRGDDTVEEGRTRCPGQHAVGDPLLSLLSDAKRAAGDAGPLFQGWLGEQGVLLLARPGAPDRGEGPEGAAPASARQ